MQILSMLRTFAQQNRQHGRPGERTRQTEMYFPSHVAARLVESTGSSLISSKSIVVMSTAGTVSSDSSTPPSLMKACFHHAGQYMVSHIRVKADRAPSCRQPIALANAAVFLTQEMQAEYEEKTLEFSTTDRTYCSRVDCATFIKPINAHGSIGSCQKCGGQTCTICKSNEHVGQDCPQDPNHQAVIDLARQEGWQTCTNCHRLVELDTGCYHMT